MTTQTRDRLLRLAAHGPQTVHWTVVRESLMGRDFDERAGLVAYDGNVVYATQKGLDYVRSLNDGSYLDF